MQIESGVHHLALNTARMKDQIEFFTDVLGAELKALYWMHGTSGMRHCFLKLNDKSYMSFVQGPPMEAAAKESAPPRMAVPGAMGHVAFSVSTMDEMMALRDRIRERGIIVLGPIDHGFCRSMYFSGLEGLSLEVACNTEQDIDERAWIDPEVVAVEGITEVELARYKNPTSYQSKGGKVANREPKPNEAVAMFRGDMAAKVLRLSEDELTKMMGGSESPVKVTPRKMGKKAAAE
jgi:catechol 2,3-dioxygenase-like lactoylglutathione lyase family enzyme